MSRRRPTAARIDRSVSCSTCEAVCCRLTVVLVPGDHVPAEMIEHGEHGVDVLKRGDDGWCVAVDRESMRCGIYEQRPAACHRFVMGGDYCCAVREAHDRRTIPSTLVD
jgi:Fe-S-cluster containining protein